MEEDEVLEELWRIKEEHAAKYGYDIRAMADALREQEAKSGHKLVSRPPKRSKRPKSPGY